VRFFFQAIDDASQGGVDAKGGVYNLLGWHSPSCRLSNGLSPRRTPGLLPLLHLDHIYYDEKLRLERLTLSRTRKALVASDHLPLAAEFSAG
jgi:endonuclease/exonuclease/phosphatase family metal-dependent hydrolase